MERSRQAISAALNGAAVGRDRVLRLWLDKADPIVEYTVRPMGKWASMVWDQRLDPQYLAAAWRRAFARAGVALGSNPWRSIRGPASTLRATLDRIGWSWPAWHTVVDGGGREYNMYRTPPVMLKELVRSDLEEQELRAWAAGAGLQGVVVPFLEPVRSVLRRRASHRVQRNGAIKAFVGGDFLTQRKRWERGGSDLCGCQHPDCLAESGTQHHRFWKCRGTDAVRQQTGDAHPRVIQRGRTSEETSSLFSRGIVDHPTCVARDARQQGSLHHVAGAELDFGERVSGQGFSDGSGIGRGRCKGFGYSACVVAEDGTLLYGRYGSAAGQRRCLSVLRCELLGALELFRMAAPPFRVGIDNSTVVKGLRKGRAWCTAGVRAHADLWVQIWNELDAIFPGMVGLEVVKVKAHRKLADVPDEPQALLDYQGNRVADEWAKEGALLEAPEQWQRQQYTQAWDDVVDVLDFVGDFAVAVGSFNDTTGKPPRRAGTKRVGRRTKPLQPGQVLHRIDATGPKLRCRVCHRVAGPRRERLRFRREACLGAPKVVRGGRLRRKTATDRYGFGCAGHILWRTGPWTWCRRCGGHARKKVYKLAEDCKGRPSGQPARERRQRLADGRDPLHAKERVGEARPLTRDEHAAFVQAVRAQLGALPS